MKFQSNALWPEGTFLIGGNISRDDTHDTVEQALEMCEALAEDGFGGEGVVFPLTCWVSHVGPSAVPMGYITKAGEIVESTVTGSRWWTLGRSQTPLSSSLGT